MFGTKSIGLQLFDRFYAYRQSLHADYQSDVEIDFGSPECNAINIAFAYMPRRDFCHLNSYDLVFLDNASEPLEVANPFIKKLLANDKVFLLSGAHLAKCHALCSKVIPLNCNIRLSHDVMVRGFYPQYYQRATANRKNSGHICYINGANRSNRQYMMDLLSKIQIPIKSSLSQGIVELPECQWEDHYDHEFRTFVNSRYDTRHHRTDYYDNSITVGINGVYGLVNPGYFMMDEYLAYRCVMFPESHWINDELFMTEKIFKCFVAGAIPWPVAGAGTHRMYNQMGYQTAWNLLPAKHQKFDQEPDHIKRYDKIIKAAEWLLQNSDVLDSRVAHDIAEHNRTNFFTNTIDTITVSRLQEVLQSTQKSNI